MAVVTDPASDPRTPGERRLARPPSDRYRSAPATGTDRADGAVAAVAASAADAASGDAHRAGSPARGVVFGAIVSLGGAAATVLLGGALAMSAGLLVVAAATGYAVALAVAAGRGEASGPGRRRLASRWIAAALAVIGIAIGQIGLWLFARAEGGVLTLPDYLGQTFGLLVPLQLVLAGAVAWWTAR